MTTEVNADSTLAIHGYTDKGVPIRYKSVILNKTGGNLSKAMDVDPHDTDPGEDDTITLRIHKRKDRYDYERHPETGELFATHVQIYDAVNSAWVEESKVKRVLESTAAKVAKAEADRKGAGTFEIKGSDALPASGDLPGGDVGDLPARVDDAFT